CTDDCKKTGNHTERSFAQHRKKGGGNRKPVTDSTKFTQEQEQADIDLPDPSSPFVKPRKTIQSTSHSIFEKYLYNADCLTMGQ
ncbi:MAG: hypothetical protein PHO54_04055, partial [Candidatus Peribacteraceae bacterium]|nr:hypothetical protein [Candidatus Peribacteraceae bacterium]